MRQKIAWNAVNLCLGTYFAMASNAIAATVVVAPSGNGDYPNIQAAIDAVENGSTILLTSGIFRGEGNRDLNLRGKEITIQSELDNPQSCILDLEGQDFDPHRGFRFESGEGASTIIRGLTVRNGWSGFGSAILCLYSDPSIENCWFINHYSESEGGAAYCFDSSARFTRCLFWRNASYAAGSAILSHGPSGVTVENCTVVENEDRVGSVTTRNDAVTTITNTIIAFSRNGLGAACGGDADFVIECSNIFGNFEGDWIDCIADEQGQNGNIHEDPQFCGLEFGDVSLNEQSPCAPGHNPDCGLIGVAPVGCGNPTPIVGVTWGKLKSKFNANH